MTVSEKVAYIKGLAEGLDLADSKEAKLIKVSLSALTTSLKTSPRLKTTYMNLLSRLTKSMKTFPQ